MRSASGRANARVLAGAATVLLIVAAAWLLTRDTTREMDRASDSVDIARPALHRDIGPAEPRSFTSDLPLREPSIVQPLDVAAADESADDAEQHLLPCVLQRWGLPVDDGGARATLDIIAVDAQDRPVAGAAVDVRGATGNGPGAAMQQFASLTTDALGRARVAPPSLAPLVRVHLPGTGCSGWVKLEYLIAPDDQPRLVVLPLLPGIHVDGIVRRADGEPAAGVSVITGNPELERVAPHAPANLTTDAQGRFALDVHEADDVVVQAADGDSVSDWASVKRAHRRGGPLELRLPGSFIVRGRLRDAEDTPIASSWVSFVPESAWVASRAMIYGVTIKEAASAATGDSGEFEITVPLPGRGWLVLDSAQFSLEAPAPLTLDAEHPAMDVELRACATASITGRVVDGGGVALAGVAVRAKPVKLTSRPADLPRAIHDAELMRAADCVTDDEGRFDLRPLHARGVYDIECVRGTGETLAEVTRPAIAAGTQDLEIAIADWHTGDASLALTVTARGSGLPVSHYSVTVQRRVQRVDGMGEDAHAAGSNEHVVDDAHGVFRRAGLRAGDFFDLSVSADGFADGVLLAVPAEREGGAVSIALDELGGIAADVRDYRGPVPWARVSVRPLDPPIAHGQTRRQVDVRTDDSGRASFDGLPPGRWRIDVQSGERTAKREVVVSPVETARATIELR